MVTPRQIFHEYQPQGLVREPLWRFCPHCGSGIAHAAPVPRCVNADCRFRVFQNPEPAVSVMVLENEQVLLCRRDERQKLGGGKWCMPCGFIEFGEDFLTAGRRETKEETGLDVEVTSILSVVSNFFSPQVHSLVTVLLARVVGGEPMAGDDAVAVGWFDPAVALPAFAFESDRHIIERYFATRIAGAPVDPRFAISAI